MRRLFLIPTRINAHKLTMQRRTDDRPRRPANRESESPYRTIDKRFICVTQRTHLLSRSVLCAHIQCDAHRRERRGRNLCVVRVYEAPTRIHANSRSWPFIEEVERRPRREESEERDRKCIPRVEKKLFLHLDREIWCRRFAWRITKFFSSFFYSCQVTRVTEKAKRINPSKLAQANYDEILGNG